MHPSWPGILVQVEELFDVFCFTLSWQALRDNFLSGKRLPAADEDEDGEPAEEPAAFMWPQMQEMLSAALPVCNSKLLEGRTEAIDTAFEQCAAVMRMALAHKEGKTPNAKGVYISALMACTPSTVSPSNRLRSTCNLYSVLLGKQPSIRSLPFMLTIMTL